MKNLVKYNSGFALVYALGLVVLVAGLIAAFLLSSRTERSVASGFAASNAARQLANTAVGLVQAQINDASTRGTGFGWTSQPGVIRSFDAEDNVTTYKLYSAAEMLHDGKPKSRSDHSSADLPDNTWKDSPATWVDLNAPVTISDPSNSNGDPIYPIIDPNALENQGPVRGLRGDGFEIDTNKAPGATATQRAPMPVRWLYVLRNGEVVLPTGSGKNATVDGAIDTGREETSNPIVGRIAFWTDDETCKVNVNTAGAGIISSTDKSTRANTDTFWDVPRASSISEADFGVSSLKPSTAGPPLNKEYQRFPGHPGTVALSAILPGLTGENYINFAPRYDASGQVPGSDRLYTSLDELIFTADPPGSTRTNSILTEDVLKTRRFFLTAHSRAPETTLFNTPRIAMWPIYQGSPINLDPKKTTAYDRLIAFCSSLKTKGGLEPYYFQRNQNRNDPKYDYNQIPRNQQLYAYLQNLTETRFPGYRGTFRGKYSSDRDQILTEIFDYIRCTNLYDDNLDEPNQYTQKYVDDSATDKDGHGYVTPIHINDTQGFGRFLTLSELGLLFICNADSEDNPNTPQFDERKSNLPSNRIIPSGPPNPGGMPLAPGEIVIQAAILLELSGVSQGWTILRPLETIQITGLDNLAVQVTLLDENQNSLSTSIYPLKLPASASYVFGDVVKWDHTYGPSMTGDNPGYRVLFHSKKAPNDSGGNSIYPFVGVPIRIKVRDMTVANRPRSTVMSLTSTGGITVQIYSGDQADSSKKIQQIPITFPPTMLPIPNLVAEGTEDGATAPRTNPEDWWSLSRDGIDGSATTYVGRFPMCESNFREELSDGSSKWLRGCLIRENYDVLRTLQPVHGDFRLIAGRQMVPPGTFAPHRLYHEPGTRLASNLTATDRIAPGFDFGASFGQGVDVSSPKAKNRAPDIPQNADLLHTLWVTRDFDNGIANSPDGAYINKPDEGNAGKSSKDGYFKRVAKDEEAAGRDFFSPNRMMPSPGMLGSLPTGVLSQTPWQTLLFRPQPSHPQSQEVRADYPPDYLFMDLFWMPVVEPYAISDRLSTAGKINMNYQILPFTYIERSTGMRAVLKPEKLTAIPNGGAATYKVYDPNENRANYRFPLDLNQTLSQFTKKFEDFNVFKTPAEICDIYMVPQGQTVATIENFWDANRLTGDNSREHIYATMFPKLTTKSNTYTVHFRVQSLKKIRGTNASEWVEDRDVVTGEYRGSTTIERFINPDPQPDPNKPNEEVFPPDYAANPSSISGAKTLDSFYKWRVIENRQFAP